VEGDQVATLFPLPPAEDHPAPQRAVTPSQASGNGHGEEAEQIALFQQYALFVSIQPAFNRRRFYRLSWQPSLWDGGR